MQKNDLKKAEELHHGGTKDANKMSQILICVCKSGDLEMVELLIASLPQPANVKLDITSSVWVAIENRNLELLKFLLHKPTVEVNLYCTKTFKFVNDNGLHSMTPLRFALGLQNSPQVVEELIRAGANVNARGQPEHTTCCY